MPGNQIYDILKKDHETVDGLLHRLKEARSGEARGLFDQVSDELIAHARAEEAVVYQALLEQEHTRAKTLAALEEHKQVEALLAELDALKPGDELWAAKLDVLADNVGHHVDEEEGELFPLARQVLSDREARDIGVRFVEARDRFKRDLAEDHAAE